MYGCKYLNFSRSNSDMELLARATVQKLEGGEEQAPLSNWLSSGGKGGGPAKAADHSRPVQQ